MVRRTEIHVSTGRRATRKNSNRNTALRRAPIPMPTRASRPREIIIPFLILNDDDDTRSTASETSSSCSSLSSSDDDDSSSWAARPIKIIRPRRRRRRYDEQQVSILERLLDVGCSMRDSPTPMCATFVDDSDTTTTTTSSYSPHHRTRAFLHGLTCTLNDTVNVARLDNISFDDDDDSQYSDHDSILPETPPPEVPRHFAMIRRHWSANYDDDDDSSVRTGDSSIATYNAILVGTTEAS